MIGHSASDFAVAGNPKFTPSQVRLGIPPLVGTMERAKREFAAALIVRACQVNGDTWGPVELRALGLVIKDDIDAGREPIASLNRNQFFRPDFHMLADGVFGRWIGAPGESAIELTEHGIESLRRWVIAEPSNG